MRQGKRVETNEENLFDGMMPPEMKVRIFAELDAKGLLRMQLVNQSNRNTAKSTDLYKHFLERDHHFTKSSLKSLSNEELEKTFFFFAKNEINDPNLKNIANEEYQASKNVTYFSIPLLIDNRCGRNNANTEDIRYLLNAQQIGDETESNQPRSYQAIIERKSNQLMTLSEIDKGYGRQRLIFACDKETKNIKTIYYTDQYVHRIELPYNNSTDIKSLIENFEKLRTDVLTLKDFEDFKSTSLMYSPIAYCPKLMEVEERLTDLAQKYNLNFPSVLLSKVRIAYICLKFLSEYKKISAKYKEQGRNANAKEFPVLETKLYSTIKNILCDLINNDKYLSFFQLKMELCDALKIDSKELSKTSFDINGWAKEIGCEVPIDLAVAKAFVETEEDQGKKDTCMMM